jgi:hypothetical protein
LEDRQAQRVRRRGHVVRDGLLLLGEAVAVEVAGRPVDARYDGWVILQEHGLRCRKWRWTNIDVMLRATLANTVSHSPT